MTLTNIFEHLKDTLEILDLSCCSGISESPMTKFYVFKSMPRLRLLDINYQSVISIEKVISLENQLQNVKICRLKYLGDHLKIAKFWNRKYIGKGSWEKALKIHSINFISMCIEITFSSIEKTFKQRSKYIFRMFSIMDAEHENIRYRKFNALINFQFQITSLLEVCQNVKNCHSSILKTFQMKFC